MEYGVRDPAKVKRWHVEEFLQRKINADVKLRTFKGYAAAFSKLEIALNNVRKYPLYYSETIDRLREKAKESLDGTSTSRGYKNPEALIAELKIPKYKLAAELQLYCGARISEISELQPGRNLIGVKGNVGKIRLTNTKGGRVRIVEVPADLYRRVEKIASKNGKFEFVRGNYAASLKRASTSAGENWHGSHGLRWNFVQNSFRAHQENGGKSFEEALQEVALEIGHTRPEITLHYLR
jgi:integrase